MTNGPRVVAEDPVERELTADAAKVHLRDKHVARTAAVVMIPGALLMLVATVAVALGGDPAAPPAAALFPFGVFVAMVYVAFANMVVRTALTDRDLRVRWGMRRFSIPLSQIVRCEARPRTGGMVANAGWAIVASRGALFVGWNDGGKARALLLPANDPEALAAAISSARCAGNARVDAASEAQSEPVVSAADGGSYEAEVSLKEVSGGRVLR